jgi:hypothetical protein
VKSLQIAHEERKKKMGEFIKKLEEKHTSTLNPTVVSDKNHGNPIDGDANSSGQDPLLEKEKAAKYCHSSKANQIKDPSIASNPSSPSDNLRPTPRTKPAHVLKTDQKFIASICLIDSGLEQREKDRLERKQAALARREEREQRKRMQEEHLEKQKLEKELEERRLIQKERERAELLAKQALELKEKLAQEQRQKWSTAVEYDLNRKKFKILIALKKLVTENRSNFFKAKCFSEQILKKRHLLELQNAYTARENKRLTSAACIHNQNQKKWFWKNWIRSMHGLKLNNDLAMHNEKNKIHVRFFAQIQGSSLRCISPPA